MQISVQGLGAVKQGCVDQLHHVIEVVGQNTAACLQNKTNNKGALSSKTTGQKWPQNQSSEEVACKLTLHDTWITTLCTMD